MKLNPAIRLGEKVCSDLGYIVPNWLEGRVNRYLLHNATEYAKAAERISPVNVASVYKPIDRNEISYKSDSQETSAIEGLQFKGLEEILDIRKFSEILRHIGKKNY
jgi:hypothetical protein